LILQALENSGASTEGRTKCVTLGVVHSEPSVSESSPYVVKLNSPELTPEIECTSAKLVTDTAGENVTRTLNTGIAAMLRGEMIINDSGYKPYLKCNRFYEVPIIDNNI
jgi:hypothetical protein